MKRFSLMLGVMAGAHLLAGLALLISSQCREWVVQLIIALGAYGAGMASFQTLPQGLVLSGAALLLLAALFRILDRRADSPFDWPAWKYLLLVAGLNFLLGVLLLIVVPPTPISGDGLWYVSVGEQLSQGRDPIWNCPAGAMEGGEPTAFWPPGYSFLLAALFSLFGPHYWPAQVVNRLLLAGIILLVYLVTDRLSHRRAAAQAALIAALIPSTNFIALTLISETWFTFLLLLILYLTVTQRRAAQVVLFGLCFGIITLTKPTALFFPLLAAGYWILRDRKWKPALVNLIVIAAVGEAVLLPWQIRNHRVFDRFILVSTNGGSNFWMGNNAYTPVHGPQMSFMAAQDTLHMYGRLNEAQRDKTFFGMGLEYALAHPLKTVLRWPEKLFFLYYRDSQTVSWTLLPAAAMIPAPVISGLYMVTDGFYHVLLFAALISAILLLRSERVTPRLYLMLGTAGYFTVMYLPFITECRYHLPMLPLFAILAAVSRAPAPES